MNLKSYALSVTAVIIIASISDMLLQNGRMKNISRMVFSIISTLVFASPVLKLIGSNVDVEDLIVESSYEVDDSFLVYCGEIRSELLVDEVKYILQEKSVKNAKISVVIDNSNYEIKNILINLDEAVIIGQSKHILNNEIADIVTQKLSLDEGRVTVVGKAIEN